MAVPKDHGLTITVFICVSLFSILLLWIFMPPTINFEEEDMEIRVMLPDEAIYTVEEILAQAEENVLRLEEEEDAEENSEAGEENAPGEEMKSEIEE